MARIQTSGLSLVVLRDEASDLRSVMERSPRIFTPSLDVLCWRPRQQAHGELILRIC